MYVFGCIHMFMYWLCVHVRMCVCVTVKCMYCVYVTTRSIQNSFIIHIFVLLDYDDVLFRWQGITYLWDFNWHITRGLHCALEGYIIACLLVAPLLLYALINWEIPPGAGPFMHLNVALTNENIKRSVIQVRYPEEEVKGNWRTEENSPHSHWSQYNIEVFKF